MFAVAFLQDATFQHFKSFFRRILVKNQSSPARPFQDGHLPLLNQSLRVLEGCALVASNFFVFL